MAHATYEFLPDQRDHYGELPGFQGVWSSAPTLEACRAEAGRGAGGIGSSSGISLHLPIPHRRRPRSQRSRASPECLRSHQSPVRTLSVRCARRGFEGPSSGRRHAFMRRSLRDGDHSERTPEPDVPRTAHRGCGRHGAGSPGRECRSRAAACVRLRLVRATSRCRGAGMLRRRRARAVRWRRPSCRCG